MRSDRKSTQAGFFTLYWTVRASFWFVPLLCVLLSIIVSQLALWFDETEAASAFVEWMPLPEATVAGARQMLSTIAGSIITIAGLVLSLTFVALTMMSQQFGPRILLVHMKDQTTQLVIGLFVGCFIYALFVLGAVGTGKFHGFVPQFSLYLGAFLAIISFLAIIYFVHHVAVSIQADTIVSRLGHDLDDAIESVVLPLIEEQVEDSKSAPENGDPHIGEETRDVLAPISGFVQVVEYPAALTLAVEHDARISYDCRPGHFVIEGCPIASLECAEACPDDLAEKFAGTVHVGEKRTQAQFAEFELNALVEVALRALSPGINDPYTAIACINHLTDAIIRLIRGHVQPAVWRDDDGVIRVKAYPQSLDHFVDSAFHPIRYAARGNTQVLLHIADALETMMGTARDDSQRKLFRDHGEVLLEDARQHVGNSADLGRIRHALRHILKDKGITQGSC